MNVSGLLFNHFGRLRSGWRFLIFLFSFILFAFIFEALSQPIAYSLRLNIREGKAVFLLLNGIFSLIPAIAIGWLCGKYLEGLPFRALGAAFTRGWLRDLAFGSLVGAATLILSVLIAMAFGDLTFRLNADSSTKAIIESLAISFVVFAVAAAFEEALFRGYMLQTFARANLAWLAIVLTSVFFCIVHLRNPDAGVISTVDTALAGVWLGIAYLKTRNLWFVWGLHLMWNWMQGSVFGIEVSGLTDISTVPLLKEIDRGPEWLTGATYGIEGGIASTAALIISTVAIYFLPVLKADDEMLAMTSSERSAVAP